MINVLIALKKNRHCFEIPACLPAGFRGNDRQVWRFFIEANCFMIHDSCSMLHDVYRAYSITLFSLITVTLISPGYLSSSSMFFAIC